MQITLNVKPKVIKVPPYDMDFSKTVRSTKEQVKRKAIGHMHYVSSTYGTGYCGLRDSETIRVINYEKRRPVIKVVTDKKLLKKGIKRQVVTPGHWVAFVYDFPVELLKLAKLKVVQGTRTFKLVNIK